MLVLDMHLPIVYEHIVKILIPYLLIWQSILLACKLIFAAILE